jgi:hypothetical protein
VRWQQVKIRSNGDVIIDEIGIMKDNCSENWIHDEC